RPMLPPPCIDSPNPMSSISSGSTPARSTAAPIATSASANASTPMRDPLYAVAIGVRAALAMTTSVGLASLDISLPRVVAPQAVPDGVSDDATGACRRPNRDTARRPRREADVLPAQHVRITEQVDRGSVQ